ncbi:unnamed protein product [Anisakis simplex]|uniref:Nse4_C domain-containing protein n=1 Tax=Anisakis simplex TaxID=6269 RepID=A0A0M3IY28_ANISI|nr:unnamed protein product [Anisakis simplex]
MQQNIGGQTVREVERLRKTAQRTATVEMKGASVGYLIALFGTESPQRMQLLQPDEAYNDHEGSFAKSLDEMMERLEAELRIRGTDRISYYEAVLHPTDFGKTVEAMYRVAYLINEGRVIYHSTEDEIQSQLSVFLSESIISLLII